MANMPGYLCMDEGKTFDRMLWWETGMSGLFYGLIVLHYYKNVLVIKPIKDITNMAMSKSQT